MDSQTNRLLLTLHDGLAGGLIRTDGDQRHLPGWSFRTVFIDERKIDFLDHFEDGLGLKGRAGQSLLDLGEEFGIEGLGVQTLEDLTVLIANTHGLLLSGTGFHP
jgi:hypothetical protein